MFYFVKTPFFIKKWHPGFVWNFPRDEQVIYLSFDDGPHPRATPFVLDQLAKYNAKATFFCIGKNVAAHPEIYRRILDEGHSVGNHTFNHLNGRKSTDKDYIADIREAARYIDSNLFRPPYGRITGFQARLLTAGENAKQSTVYRIIMWDVLSADFDLAVSREKCAANVIKNARAGSIVVFHDSEKAFPKLEHALPETLAHFNAKGYRFEAVR